MKRMTIVLIAIAVLFGGGAIWYIYADTTAKNTIDLLGNAKITFEGVSGSGEVRVKKNILYDKSNGQLEQFVKDVRVEPASHKYLKNGDKVRIIAKYDLTWAKNLDLNIVNDVREVTVKGLKERYSSASAVPNDLIRETKENARKAIEDAQIGDNIKREYTYCGTYFIKGEISDSLFSVYKVKGIWTNPDFYYSGIVQISTNLSAKERKDIGWGSKLNYEPYESITKESQIDTGLRYAFEHEIVHSGKVIKITKVD